MVQPPTLRVKAFTSGLVLSLIGAVMANEPADARVRAQPNAGYAAPSINVQEPAPVEAKLSIAEQDIALLKQRAERVTSPIAAKASNALSNSRATAGQRLDIGPIGSSADAAWLLGLVYAHGAGVAQDLGQSQQWFERALAGGQALGAAGLAWCALEGCKGQVNIPLARTYIASLKKTNLARALYFEWLVESKLSPFQPGTQPSPDGNAGSGDLVARDTLAQSARLGDIHALVELGLDSVAAQRISAARGYFQRAASTSSAARHNLRLLDTQQGIVNAADQSQTVNYASMDAAALLSAAQRNHRGSGQPVNYTEAIRLYRMAQARGSAQAQDMLALIFSRTSATGEVDLAWMQSLAQLDVSGPTPSYKAYAAPLFQRERTPLYDYLPELWKARVDKLS
jgi:uncharacterized protein